MPQTTFDLTLMIGLLTFAFALGGFQMLILWRVARLEKAFENGISARLDKIEHRCIEQHGRGNDL